MMAGSGHSSSVGSSVRRVRMGRQWVMYFFLTAATSLSFPQFMKLFEPGSVRSKFLELFAGFVVVAATALDFRENGLLASLVLFVYSCSISPLLRFHDRFRLASVCASSVFLMTCIGLL